MTCNNTRNWSISAELLVVEAEKLWLDVKIIDIDKNLFTIEGNWIIRHFKNVDWWLNTSYGFRVTKFKDYTYLLLDHYWIRVPKTTYINRKDKDNYREVLKDIVFPVVTKPVDWTHWDWVSIDIKSMDELKNALEYSFWTSVEKVVVQEQIQWFDHRIVVLWWKMVAASLRIQPYIIWDGEKTIKQLIDLENKNPLRWKWNHNTPLSQIKVDNESIEIIKKQWFTLNSILDKWLKVLIRKNANLSTGWLSIDVTDIVHPTVKESCEKSAKILTLWLAWIDFMSTDISKSIDETKWAIIEINHTPGLRMHHFPYEWISRNIAKEILLLSFNL